MTRPSNWRDYGIVAGLLAPVLTAIWVVPWFVTQDGLAHLYNATIIVDSFAADSAFRPYYEVRWSPLPNWGGHLGLVGLLTVVSPWVADRIMMSATLLGFAFAVVWARGRIAEGRASAAALTLAALSALSFSWLMGFAGFQLGACLFPITLAVWWFGRDDLRTGRMIGLGALLVLGYFCHLVSLGLTACALGFLALFAPTPDDDGDNGDGEATGAWPSRLIRTGICLTPLVFLGALYIGLSREGGPMRPKLPSASMFLSIWGWVGRLGWVDPISVARKDILPFTDRSGSIFAVFAPAVWLGVAAALGFVALILGKRRNNRRDRERLVWLALAATLVFGGVFGPDAMGEGHGDYLPQRVALLGLAALIPAIDLGSESERRSKTANLATWALGIALGLQTLVVWDYAIDARDQAGAIAEASATVEPGARVASLLANLETKFRVNAALHADCWAGVARRAIVWNNYETRYYYFPVQFRPEIVGPDSIELERIALMNAPGEAEERRLKWLRLLESHHDQIDELIVWKRAPGLDAITERFFELADDRGEARMFRPRGREPLTSSSLW